MPEHIKKMVERFKQENGNRDYTQKELIIYLVKRIDDLPCMEHMSKIQENSTRGKFIMWFLGIETSIILALFILIFNKIL